MSNKKHGMDGTKTYDCWINMKQRCLNKKSPIFKYYGGRGIKVCKRWLKFENFYKDMGTMPIGFSIERRDVNKGYNLKNCYWLSRKLQSRNIRKSIFVEINGESKNLIDWCADLKLNHKVVRQRIKRDGLSPMEAINKPFLKTRNKNVYL